ncbi:MAG: cysteine rich repeat-containing protein [Methylobacterium sp.]|uniref:hypothetical protein n=1 Tax=Methylobacterium sp. TaxID=409 RepID=UPI0025DC9221|nr:hypothetical protein [Methylobacterium sp.]MBX9931342.1 cysteine rich repeat-containing protein [Methylobacterium sp.]
MLIRLATIATLISTVAVAAPAPDRAALKRHCTGDYLNYCGDIDPDSPEVQACFKKNKPQLSAACQAAIGSYTKAQKGS